MKELASSSVSASKYFASLKKVPMGAFEVYFMGKCVYSKLKNKKWPQLDNIVSKCKELYKEYSKSNLAQSDYDSRDFRLTSSSYSSNTKFGQKQLAPKVQNSLSGTRYIWSDQKKVKHAKLQPLK